jgi:hypothetical protein
LGLNLFIQTAVSPQNSGSLIRAGVFLFNRGGFHGINESLSLNGDGSFLANRGLETVKTISD